MYRYKLIAKRLAPVIIAIIAIAALCLYIYAIGCVLTEVGKI